MTCSSRGWCGPRAAHVRSKVLVLVVGLSLSGMDSESVATEADTGFAKSVETYEVIGRRSRVITAASSFVRDAETFEHRVIESSGDLLEVTPGVNVGQHAGGGKANQYLVRGFDADHGTDLAISFDGVPVNARSHAHLTGFADVHFVIPETLQEVSISKGPYDVTDGDFATAGAIDFIPRQFVEESIVKAEYGDFNTQRYLGVFSPRDHASSASSIRSLFAIDVSGSDGPFGNGEDFWRGSAFGSMAYDVDPRTTVDGWVSSYLAEWNASGQIPEREVAAGRLSRFGAIDPTEGGESQRHAALLRIRSAPSVGTEIEAAVWGSHYQLDLYSNFTFFLDDAVAGDGILQRDDRWSWGAWLVGTRDLDPVLPAAIRFGIDLRGDRVRARLDRQTRRRVTASVNDDRLFEQSVAAYVDVDAEPVPWLRVVAGARAEMVWFDGRDPRGLTAGEGSDFEYLVLPKGSLVLTPFGSAGLVDLDHATLSTIRIFVNAGQGFHSNDVRDAISPDPLSRALTLATGWEVGFRVSPFERVELAAAYWWLDLQRESVFVADSGGLELSGASKREGVEASIQWEPWNWLVLDADVAYSRSRFVAGGVVPQAPRLVISAGALARHRNGLSAELRVRALGDRAAEETCCRELRGYSVWNLAIRYEQERFGASVSIENLFDRDYRSAEFFYASRLPGEAGPVGDFHFVPGNPRAIRASVWARF